VGPWRRRGYKGCWTPLKRNAKLVVRGHILLHGTSSYEMFTQLNREMRPSSLVIATKLVKSFLYVSHSLLLASYFRSCCSVGSTVSMSRAYVIAALLALPTRSHTHARTRARKIERHSYCRRDNLVYFP